MSNSRAVLILSALLATTGCGPELLGGTQDEGEVRTVATSEESSAGSHATPGDDPLAASGQRTDASAPGSPALQESGALLDGEIYFEAAVFLLTEDGDTVPLTDGVVPGSFRIAGTDDVAIGREDVEARSYSTVRIVFTRAEAIVTSGLQVGGTPIVGLVRVDLGATQRLVVERSLGLNVEPRTTQTLVVDLDAHEWLPAVTLPGSFVPGFAFASAVDVRLQ